MFQDITMRARLTAFHALAECFKEPTAEFVQDILDGTLQGVLREAFEELAIGAQFDELTLDEAGSLGEVTEALTDEYYALFKGPFPPYVVPVESVYQPWAESSAAASCGKERDMIMGDPAIEMLKRYQADGIQIPDAFKPYPDHIALILEYAGLLLERGTPQAYQEFAAAHLEWVEALRGDIHATTTNRFYRAIADLLCAFVRGELDLIRSGHTCSPQSVSTLSA